MAALVMTLLATLGPTIPTPWPALALDTGLGKTLYVGSMLLLGIGSLVARHAENAKTEQGQEARHNDLVARFEALTTIARQLNQTREAVIRVGHVARPLLDTMGNFEEITVNFAAVQSAALSDKHIISPPSIPSGEHVPSPTIVLPKAVADATATLAEIRQKPPQTNEAVLAATKKLQSSVGAVLTATGYPGALSVGYLPARPTSPSTPHSEEPDAPSENR
jgi:hypothetical protein